VIRGACSVIREEGEFMKEEAPVTTARTKMGTTLLMPPPVILQRGGKRLKRKGMGFALLQQSAKSAKKRGVREGVRGS
jgi:hypothetical protein